MTNLLDYYAQRASEYDQIYLKPERQDDITSVSERITKLLKNRNVLEIACGTGFWTQYFAPYAKSTTATDYNRQVLDIAEQRLENVENVRLLQADAFLLKNLPESFDAALAAFWWSHLEKSRVSSFLQTLNSKLVPGSCVVLIDNLYVEGSSTPISRIDEYGNTYQTRELASGNKFEVLKNFTTKDEFLSAAGSIGTNLHFEEFTYFWCGWFETRAH